MYTAPREKYPKKSSEFFWSSKSEKSVFRLFCTKLLKEYRRKSRIRSELHSALRNRLETFRKPSKHFMKGSRCIWGVPGSQGGAKCRKNGPITVPGSLLYKGEIHIFDQKLSCVPRNRPETCQKASKHF